MTSQRRLHSSRARNILLNVNSSAHPTLHSLVSDIERLTGKPIEFLEMPELQGSGTTGLWFERETRHVILEPPPVSVFYQRFTRIHELGHIASAHLGVAKPPSHTRRPFASMTVEDLMAAINEHRLQNNHVNEQIAEAFAHHFDSLCRRAARPRRSLYEASIA